MRLACSSITTLRANLLDDIEHCADAQCSYLEVWLTKLEEHISRGGKFASASYIREHMAERKVFFIGAAYQGGLFTEDAAKRKEAFSQFQTRLALCQEFAIPTLILAPDSFQQMDAARFELVQTVLLQATELASSFDVKLALEFQSRSEWCTCLSTASELVQMIDSPSLGICLDLFHYYTGPSKLEDLAMLPMEKLLAVQLCDVSGTSREFATDADRILPGEGDFQVKRVVDALRQAGYQGYVTSELMNPALWAMKPKEVLAMSYLAVQRMVGS